MPTFVRRGFDAYLDLALEWQEVLQPVEDWQSLRLLFALAVQERLIEPNTSKEHISLEVSPERFRLRVGSITADYPKHEILEWRDDDRHVEGYARALERIVELANGEQFSRSRLPA